MNSVQVPKINYGKSPTKRAIVNVLDAVLTKYKYASLAELNAVLKLYNLTADRGNQEGIIFRKRGLVYRVLDEKGNKIGVPVKASSIYNKPTLSYLETKFQENGQLKEQFKKSLKTSIDWIMVKPPKSLEAFKRSLEKEKISLAIRQNDNGIVYGLTYIDHNTKSVFNGSDIGKEYSAKAILEKCGTTQSLISEKANEQKQLNKDETISVDIDKSRESRQDLFKALDVLITPQEQFNYLPYDLRKHKRKRKKF